MISFKNKSVLVTGGSRGIGASTVTLFAKLGANVAYNYQSNKTAADKQLQKIKKYPGNHFSEACDISNFEQVKKFVSHVIDKLSTIDILVNNAGIFRSHNGPQIQNEFALLLHNASHVHLLLP